MMVDYIGKNDKNYPELLKEISDPPDGLYWRGPILKNRMLAVVGSRKVTSYGLAVIEKLISGLVGTDIIIVSGLAFGVDAEAHRSALKFGLKTIAVLPSGVDNPHPRTNAGLAQQILNHDGALISEYKPGTIPHKNHFPMRNRIIAGMTSATILIEAGDRSGSLITARLALESGRDVLAVPGSIFSPVSVGTNMLIANGARLITSADDIKQEIGIKEQIKSENKAPLNEIEKIIFDEITNGKFKIDDLVVKLSTPAHELMRGLTGLEIKGFIKKVDSEYVAI